MKSRCWNEEISFACEIWSTWDLGPGETCNAPTPAKVIETKWVFDVKRDGKRNVIQGKAQIRPKGCWKIQVFSFTEDCYPVFKWATVRLLYVWAVKFEWHRQFMDSKNAFLNASLPDKIYVAQVEGLVKEGSEEFVYLLLKVLNWTRQASR